MHNVGQGFYAKEMAFKAKGEGKKRCKAEGGMAMKATDD